MIVVPVVSSSSAANNAATALEEALAEQTGLTVEVVPVQSYAEAFGALCGVGLGEVNIIWVDGVTYAAAHAEGCGIPSLMVERGRGNNAATGEVVQVIANNEAEITGMDDLGDRTFCRLGYDDLYSWLIPSVMLQMNGVNPLTDLEAINDYEDETELLEAIAAGDCDVGALPETEFEDLANADIRDAVSVLDESVSIPYAIMMYPPETPLGVRIAVEDAMLAIAGGSGAAALEDLLGQDELVRVDADDLSDVRAFFESAGLDLAQLND